MRGARDATSSALGRARPLRRALAALLCAAGTLPAGPALAEIFWRTGGAAEHCLRELGATDVYATDVTLNGAPGKLTACAVPAASSRVAASLAQRLGLPRDAAAGGALITHAEKGRLIRLFVLPSASGEDASLVLTFTQSARDAARAAREPPAWPDGLPALAARPVFTAVCDATRTTFVTGESAEAPDAAAQSAAQALQAAGWTQTSPKAPGLGIFASGRKTCLVLTRADARTSRTTISLLQREGASR